MMRGLEGVEGEERGNVEGGTVSMLSKKCWRPSNKDSSSFTSSSWRNKEVNWTRESCMTREKWHTCCTSFSRECTLKHDL